jgi:hypothetical protein
MYAKIWLIRLKKFWNGRFLDNVMKRELENFIDSMPHIRLATRINGLRLHDGRRISKDRFENINTSYDSMVNKGGIYGQKIVIEVFVYLLEVTEAAKKWPEKAKRDFKWVSPREATTLLREPALVELCMRLAEVPA